MRKIFIDTSGWLAIVVKSDSLYLKASEIYFDRYAQGFEFVTHDGVLLEVGNSLSSVRGRQLAVRLVETIKTSARISLLHVSEELYEAGWRLYAARPDKEWGAVDCISFALMEREGILEALTADKHFEQAGFTKLL